MGQRDDRFRGKPERYACALPATEPKPPFLTVASAVFLAWIERLTTTRQH